MLPTEDRRDARCSRRHSRRRLLQIGGLGVVGLSLPEFLWARRSDAATPAKACIFVFMFGGPSQLDTFDPKPHAPDGIRGPYTSIATPVPGTQVTEMLPGLAKQADRFALIRSLTHAKRQHPDAVPFCLSGRKNPDENTPYIGSLVVHERPIQANLPPYVWLQDIVGGVDTSYLKGGFLGQSYAPMLVGKDFDNPSKPGFRLKAFDPADGLTTDRLESRFQLLNRLEREGSPVLRSVAAADFQRYQEQAYDLIAGPHARRAFDLNREPDVVRDRYGRGPLGQNLLLARRLVEAGVRLVTVNAWCGIAPGSEWLKHTQGWDHHGAAVQKCGIFSNGTFGLGFCLPQFDQALSTLLTELSERGLLESTLVVAVGEFGRTPRISNAPYAGRHHWPDCYTGLLAGGGVRGGAVYGSSDAHAAYVQSHPVSPEDLSATIFHALGISPETRIGPDQFSLRVSDGQPLTELFG